jgi:2-methylcitrate dehydratase PrpD
MTTMVRQLADWVCDLREHPLPEDVVGATRWAMLDILGVCVRGAGLSVVRPALELARTMPAPNGATLVVYGDRCAVGYGAYANAAFAHSCEFDDGHLRAGHPGAVVVPTALAVGEQVDASGDDLLRAVVAGYQVMALTLAPIHRRVLEIGWHGMKIAGVFGAAAAAGFLLGLDAPTLAHALAIAASDASGTMEYDQTGGEVKRLHAAMAARSGIDAAILAAAGMTGPPSAFEGPRGIWRLFGWDSEPVFDETLWQRFQIFDRLVKLRPSVGTNHAALDAVTTMVRDSPFGPDDVDGISVTIAPALYPKASAIRRPSDQIGAQTSLAFNLALVVAKGDDRLDHYLDPEVWQDETVGALTDRVTVAAGAPSAGRSVDLGATVVVQLKDGRRLERRVDAFRGHPSNPATGQEVEAKYRSLADDVLGAGPASALAAAVGGLDSTTSARQLAELTVTGQRKAPPWSVKRRGEYGPSLNSARAGSSVWRSR